MLRNYVRNGGKVSQVKNQLEWKHDVGGQCDQLSL
jgi:hypothetical protein